MNIWVIVLAVIAVVGLLVSLIVKSEIKIKKFTLHTFWIVPLIVAIILLATQLVNWNDMVSFMTSSSSINPLQILVLFFSMAFISIVLDEAGFFTYLASKVVNKAKGSQIKVFIFIYLLTSILTVFTSNDIIILTFTPFLIYFAKRAKINPIPYLVSEFVAANTWSVLFLIGNPTNIYLGESFGITFVDYLINMWPVALFAGVTSFGVMFLVFWKKLKEPFDTQCEVEPIKDKPLMIASLICLIGCLAMMITSSFIPEIHLWMIAGIAAATLLVFLLIYLLIIKKPIEIWSSVKRLPYNLIPFLLSMFIIVLSLKTGGVIEELAKVLSNGNTVFGYAATSFLISNFVNNIPMSVLFTEILKVSSIELNAVYATILGSNIGAILSPFGALAGIMWMSILKHNDVKYSFIDFLKYGAIIAIPTMAIATLGIFFIH